LKQLPWAARPPQDINRVAFKPLSRPPARFPPGQ
jgi:hypothetical protein